eukprot:g58852.t1
MRLWKEWFKMLDCFDWWRKGRATDRSGDQFGEKVAQLTGQARVTEEQEAMGVAPTKPESTVTMMTDVCNEQGCILCPVCHKMFNACQCDLAQDWKENQQVCRIGD